MGVIYGTSGPDKVDINYRGNDTIYLYEGDDQVHSRAEGNYDIFLGNGDDSYVGNGLAFRPKNYDRVWGGNGEDSFVIRTDHSEYYGEDGNDSFSSIGLSNVIGGGIGRDRVSYAIQDNDAYLRGNGIYANLDQGFATSGGYRQETLLNIEDVTGTKAADKLVGSEDSNDLVGLSGRDKIDGKGGDDTLTGGAKADRMIGGGGADSFIFLTTSDASANGKTEVIVDFVTGADRIDLSAIDANTATATDDAFTFVGTAAFTGVAGELRYDLGILTGDVNGDSIADFAIELKNAPTLIVTDLDL